MECITSFFSNAKSVGGIPNSKEVCIYRVDINYHLFFASTLCVFSQLQKNMRVVSGISPPLKIATNSPGCQSFVAVREVRDLT